MITRYLIFVLADIVFGYVPQAAGCAIALFAIANEKLCSRKFLSTTVIFSAIAILIRTAYNIKLIDFGFHTILIWGIFILVAIGFNRFPAMQSICSILLAGILITAAELITSGALILIYGNAAFTSIMNNTQTLDGRIVKAACGVPANILFVVFVLIMYFVRKAMAKKKTQGNIAEASENNGI
jgi:hypothetical protein